MSNVKQTDETRISFAKKDFKNETVVTFLGDTYSGKTVYCALLKNTIAKHLYDSTGGEYEGLAKYGSEKINYIIKNIYEGEFPEKTKLDAKTKVVMEITSPKLNTPIKITLQDMPGETYYEFIEKEIVDEDVENRLKDIMQHHIKKGEHYGPFTHLIFAKIYVIVMDCSKYDQWPGMEGELATTIENLYKYKDYVDMTVRGKIYDPIAILFTKYDTLDPDDKKDPDKLFKELREVNAAFRKYVTYMPKCFMSEVNARYLNDEEIKDIIDNKIDESDKESISLQMDLKKQSANTRSLKKLTMDQQSFLNDLNSKLNNLKNDPNTVANTASDIQKITTMVENDIKDLKSEISKTKNSYNVAIICEQNTRAKINDMKNDQSVNREFTLESLGIPDHIPIQKLKYNEDEIIKLTNWIIQMNHELNNRSNIG